ncbi:class I SAM-dependent methyltransferase [Haloprofundus halobius]|uniref:class I SAM-dependent methyltransferase n=1 Tax=Haloprofundus halobius TaxID=2876194 RepID=UPI001CCA28E0|nr:class I SAM-dependent methyltransferase [Haloprofundus halobius]
MESEVDGRYDIEGFAFIGRTFDEYRRMFDLDVDALDGRRVLDCPGGSCSFAAEAAARGVDAVAVDPLYAADVESLVARGRDDVERAASALSEVERLYRWTFYDDPDDVADYRRAALERFRLDACANPGRYVAARLPSLPFADDSFSLVLSAHLLFLYDDRLDAAFHRAALSELLRVARDELRVFPLSGFDATRSARLDDALETLEANGYDATVEDVPFEFQRDANELLRIRAEQH